MTLKELELYIFTNIFIFNNKIQIAGNEILKDISIKQWLLLLVILKKERECPSLTDIAEAFGSTRQNVTKMIELLEKNGYVTTGRKEKDKRNITVSVTPKAYELFSEFDSRIGEFLQIMFKDISDVRLKIVFSVFEMLQRNLEGTKTAEQHSADVKGEITSKEKDGSKPRIQPYDYLIL